MSLINTFKEKQRIKQEKELCSQAEDYITLSDFNSSIYIAYQGIPLIPVKEDWAPKQVLEELCKIRQNFINYKKKEIC